MKQELDSIPFVPEDYAGACFNDVGAEYIKYFDRETESFVVFSTGLSPSIRYVLLPYTEECKAWRVLEEVLNLSSDGEVIQLLNNGSRHGIFRKLRELNAPLDDAREIAQRKYLLGWQTLQQVQFPIPD